MALFFVTLHYKFSVHLQNEIEQWTFQCYAMWVQRFTV